MTTSESRSWASSDYDNRVPRPCDDLPEPEELLAEIRTLFEEAMGELEELEALLPATAGAAE
jgi:hypothetical protein